jgi:predicted HicB family RNase H-like nuclease
MSQVRISDEARKNLKLQAAKEDRSMQEIVETLILKYIAKGGDK